MIRRFMVGALTLLAGWADGATAAVAVADRGRLWADHRVPFAICEYLSVPQADTRPRTRGCERGGRPLAAQEAAKVREAVTTWNAVFGTDLSFVEVGAMSRSTRGVLFAKSRHVNNCSTDRIGRPLISRRTHVRIGAYCNRFAAAETPVGTVLHEMMHVAGFYHEQQRPDRDAFLKSRVPDGLVSVLLDRDGATQWLKGNRFVTLALTPYDFGSIMHYPVRDPRRAVLTSRGQERLEDQGLTMSDPGRRDGLSLDDIAGVRRLYGRMPKQNIAERRTSTEPASSRL